MAEATSSTSLCPRLQRPCSLRSFGIEQTVTESKEITEVSETSAGDGIFDAANDGIAGFCNNVAALQQGECKRGIREFFQACLCLLTEKWPKWLHSERMRLQATASDDLADFT